MNNPAHAGRGGLGRRRRSRLGFPRIRRYQTQSSHRTNLRAPRCIAARRRSYIAEPHPNVLNLTSLMTFVSGSTLIWSRITSPHCQGHVISTYAGYLAIAGITYSWRSDQSLAHRLIGFVQCSDVPRARVVCCRGCQLPRSNEFEEVAEEVGWATHDQGPSRGNAAVVVEKPGAQSDGSPGPRRAAARLPELGTTLRGLFSRAFWVMW
jgi:hypothetical protein